MDRVLVWGEGFHNSLNPNFALRRSEQLRNFFIAMNATRDTAAQRVSATPPPLAPEEISATEWFYMGSMACSFAAGAGFPGRVLAERSFIWHCGPVGAGGSSRVFTREHLAQTAQIQTIVCIPAPDGVIEFGTTALVISTLYLL